MDLRAVKALALAVTLVAAAPGRADDRREARVEALREAVEALDRAMAALSRLPPSRPSRAAMGELGIARVKVLEALRLSELAPPRPLHAAPEPMSDGDFSELLAQIQKAAFGSERVALVKDAAKRNRFTCEQVRRVVALLDFGSEQVEAAAAMYPRVVDKSDFFKVIGELKFQGDREALRRRVEEWDRAGLAPPGVDRP